MSAENNETRPRKILHIHVCDGGGVPRAMEAYIRATPEFEHVVLAPDAPAADVRAKYLALPDGITARLSAVRNVVNDEHPDIVHAHSSIAGVLTRIQPIAPPIVYQPHAYKFVDPTVAAPIQFGLKAVEAALARRSAVIATLSDHEDELSHSFGRGIKTHKIPNVTSAKPDESHPATGYATDNHVFMVGRIAKQKDPAFFAEVARLVHQELPEATFTWIGDGDSGPKAALAENGVIITGWLNQAELEDELAKPGLFFSSASYEGFPIAALDAAAYEHPIVAREIPAYTEFEVPSGTTPAECARLIVDALKGGETAVVARENSARLNAAMTQAAQHDALVELYSLK